MKDERGRGKQETLTIVVNGQMLAVLAQDAGREVYHGRHEAVRFIGNEPSLNKLTWIFERAPDLFELQRHGNSLLLRRLERMKAKG